MSQSAARYRQTLEIIIRVRWLPVAVVLLCLTAILWILISPATWQVPLVLAAIAVPLAILGKEPSR